MATGDDWRRAAARHRRRSGGPARATLPVLLLLGLLTTTACGMPGTAAPEHEPGSTAADVEPAPLPSARAEPGGAAAHEEQADVAGPPATTGTEAAEVRTRGAAVPVGDVTVHVLADDVLEVTAPDAGSAVLTLGHGDAAAAGTTAGSDVGPTGPGAAAGTVLVVGPEGSTPELLEDGSVLLRAGDGTVLVGLSPPAPNGPATADRSPVDLPAPDVVRITGPAGGFSTWAGSVAVGGTDWGDREGGASLAVAPTAWARAAGMAGEAAVWQEVVRAAPEVDLPVVRDQLTCHALGARDKPTWNLEPWRPDVGLLGVLAAACNP